MSAMPQQLHPERPKGGKSGQYVSAQTFGRIRDYAIREPSFTKAFAAWELGLSVSAVGPAVDALLNAGIVIEIEPRKGPYGAVYQYDPPKDGRPVSRLFRELDDARIAGVGVEAAQRGVVVPHTRTEGPSGKPGRDRKRQAKGVRVKRARQGT